MSESASIHYRCTTDNLQAILEHYNDFGFVVLTDVDPVLSNTLRQMVSRLSGLTESQIAEAGSSGNIGLSMEARNKLARVETTSRLKAVLLDALGELVVQLLGPIIHISHTFHPQVKSGESGYILEGYSGDGKEVVAQYGLHQDFTAARVVTSPNAMVCWVPLNSCRDNEIRLYRMDRQRGLLTNTWLPPNHPGLTRLGDYVDVKACAGQILLFNFLVLHGGSHPGPGTRISCDVRFFPFCGILNSSAIVRRSEPVEWARNRITELAGREVLLGPLYETLAYLGFSMNYTDLSRNSVLHWAQFIEYFVRRNRIGQESAVREFVNSEAGFNDAESYLNRLSDLMLAARPYESIYPALTTRQKALCAQLLA